MHSYLKVVDDTNNDHVFHHFDDRLKEETAEAYIRGMVTQSTTKTPTTMSLYRPPLHAGPWDVLPLVGHRPKEAIETDLLVAQQQDDVVEMECRLAELTMLNSRYGRRGQS